MTHLESPAIARERILRTVPGTSGAPIVAFDGVRFKGRSRTRRLIASWRGFVGEIVGITERERFETEYCGSRHLLIAYEGVVRQQGETVLDGVQRSRLCDLRQKMTFVPAGCSFQEWQEPRAPGRAIYFYFEPSGPGTEPASGHMPIELEPRLFFDCPSLGQTVRKLTSLIEGGPSACALYAEALGAVLAHELRRLDGRRAPAAPPMRGGLAGWQCRVLKDYIEEHLAEPVPLATLAELTQLSPCHLSRAFKQSFGMPPHRFHVSRRIERAKMLLAEPAQSVTAIALDLGFSETSSFTVAFRKFTGRTPTEYRRSLV